MADIQVIVSPATVTTVEVPSPVAYPSVIYSGVQGPAGANGTGSENVIYASSVAALDSNINSGGGTDDTAALQAVLDQANTSENKPIELVMDGVALVSTLRVWRNTTIRCLPNCGFFQAAGSNWHLLTTGYVLPTEPSHDNISLFGGIYNCNGNNQSKWENDHDPEADNWGWVFGLWIGWFKNFTMRDVLVRNAKTFSISLMQGENVVIEDCASLWDDGGDGDVGRNRDGIHLWGPLNNVRVKGYVSNGDDDTLALNTDENTYATDWPTAQPRRGTGGVLSNLVFEDIEFRNASNGIRFYSDGPVAAYRKVKNAVFRNLFGNITSLSMNDTADVSKTYIEIHGWNVTGQNNIYIQNAQKVRLSAIAPLTPVNVSALKTAGDGFSADLGWSGGTASIQTALLSHFEGSNGSSSFIDSSGNGNDLNASGNVSITTSEHKFGASCAYFADNEATLQTSSSLFAFGLSDFTIEMFVGLYNYLANDSGTALFENSSTGGSRVNSFVWVINTDGYMQVFSGGSFKVTGQIQVPTGDWAHIALVRKDGVLTQYVNGVVDGSVSLITSILENNALIGALADDAPYSFQGYIDDLRVVSGKAVYTENFTPPTAQLELVTS